MASSITQKPICPYCESVRKSWTNDPCQCAEAQADREAGWADMSRQAAERQAQSAAREAKQKAKSEKLDAVRREGWADLRRQAAEDQDLAARTSAVELADLAEREERLKARWVRRQQEEDARFAQQGEDAPPDTIPAFADFVKEVSLTGGDRLPSAFTRSDGKTLIYESRFNSLLGEVGVGKSWVGLMATIQCLRAGRHVIWWDREDYPGTMARRLQALKATDLIGCPELAWTDGDFQSDPVVMAEALAFLDGGSGPGMVVIDAATSHGCPSDGADVGDWLKAFIDPWETAGHTVLLLDHVPKTKKDRPRGGIGSVTKFERIDGACLYLHGSPWNLMEGGYIHCTLHKDRNGQVPAILLATASTISASWDGPTLAYTIGPPSTNGDGENLEESLLEELESAGPNGVKGSKAIRELLKGKRARDIDSACQQLLDSGLIERVKDGRSYTYKTAG